MKKNANKRAVSLEYANALVHSREVRSGDWRLVQKVRRAMSNELRNLASAVPAVVHCKWENRAPVLEVYAPNGTQIEVSGKKDMVKDAPAVIKLDKKFTGKTVDVTLKNGGKTAKLLKYLLPPLAQN